MKRLNKKLTTLILAGVCAASVGVASVGVLTSADEPAAKTYKLTSVFDKSEKAEIGSKALTVGGAETTAFTLGNGDSVSMKKDLAFKWFSAGNAKYLTLDFEFESMDFEQVIFTIESATSVANEDQKAVNAVKFISKGDDGLLAVVMNGETEGAEVDLGAVKAVSLQLAASDAFDEFKVLANATEIGSFKEVGANFADYTTDKICPLKIEAKWADTTDKKAVVLLKNVNGQSFENVIKSTDETPTYSVTDTAAPVLVVNEDIASFQYGTAFSLSYEKIDVLQSSSLNESKKYYQYNPADTKADISKILSSSVYFMDTVYYTKADGSGYSKKKEGDYTKVTSVYEDKGEEYVAISFELSDDSKKKETYDLAWYANDKASFKLSEDEAAVDYIKIKKKETSPTYKFIEATGGANVIADQAAFNDAISKYQAALAEKTAEAYEGDDEKVTLPDVAWLIEDKEGSYRSLKFTISYKSPSSSNPTASSALNYNGLTIPTKKAGVYEFKVFATDRTGNTMEYYHEGELVSLTNSNVWEIEEIPKFEFTVKDSDIKVKDSSESNRKTSKALDQTYSLSGMTVIGAESSVSEYALYRFDADKYDGTVSEDKFHTVKYETIRSKAITKLNEVGEGKTYATYFDLYMDIYTKELAGEAGAAALKSAFVRVNPYDAKITEADEEWDTHNKYSWNESSKSFKTAEQGAYLIVMDVRESDNLMQRAVGYKVVIVDFKKDVVKGDSDFSAWVKNNVVSVILFGVAAVLLVVIVILLFVKPSDETLEDVDANAAKKAKKKE